MKYDELALLSTKSRFSDFLNLQHSKLIPNENNFQIFFDFVIFRLFVLE